MCRTIFMNEGSEGVTLVHQTREIYTEQNHSSVLNPSLRLPSIV